ncbi:MAG: hypothetical protein F4X02_07380 [Chloroflexi bacterium]|nr:hypothetical protein [Chloroflexota bacterium]
MSIEDSIFVMSAHNTREVTASYCQHLFDDFEIEEVEVVVGQERVSVVKPLMSIDTFRYFPPELIKQIMHDKVGFDPNIMIAIYYRKPTPCIEALRNDVLRGVAGLIKTINCSLAVSFTDMYVLSYHDGELMIMENPHFKFWTEERLRLFADIPYKF